MEPRPDFFPVYVSGQYLTSEHLNETHNFLWQQEKSTRYSLIGNGIVEGFDADVTGNAALQSIKFSGGVAVTSDGYIIREEKGFYFEKGLAIDLSWYRLPDSSAHLLEKVEYEKIKADLGATSETVFKAIEVIPESVLPANLPDGAKNMDTLGVTAAQALSNYVLIAWVGISDAENNHCQQGDCNTKGVQRNFRVRYFMVKKTDIPEMGILHNELESCSVNRIEKLCDAGSVSGLNSKSWNAWNKSLAEIQPYFTKNTAGKQLTYLIELLGQDLESFFNNAIAKLQDISNTVKVDSCPQYYNLFTGDLAKAINELVFAYNDYTREYQSYSTGRTERTIVLGNFRQTGFDSRRYYFMPMGAQLQQKSEKTRLRQLLMRVFSLVDNFIVQSKLKAQSSIVPIKPQLIPTIAAGQVLLQNCAIPYYYDVLEDNINNDVLKYWNPQGGKLRNIRCYYDTKIPGRENDGFKLPGTDWYYYNFFRLEGHLGMPKGEAMAAVRNLINAWGMPIQLLDCDVTYKGPQKWKGWYDMFLTNVNKWTVELRKTYPDIGDYTFAPIKKVQERITQTSYRDIEGVMKIYNDFNAYSGVMYNPPKQQGLKEKKGLENKVTEKMGLPGSAYEHYMQKVPKKDLEAMSVGIKEIMAEEGATTSTSRLLVLSDLYDLEYMGGSLRGGTLILLHDGSKIVGDGCLPYYYRVNESRVYDPVG